MKCNHLSDTLCSGLPPPLIFPPFLDLGGAGIGDQLAIGVPSFSLFFPSVTWR